MPYVKVKGWYKTMTVILVLAFFITFIAIDYFRNRGKVMEIVPAAQTARTATVAPVGGEFVAGFLTPETVGYHPGHGWVARERKNVVRVGADEFAAALLGKVDRIELPTPGQWVRQGQKVLAFHRNGERTEMVSPTEGEVLSVNTELAANPGALRQDPYGKGWLMTMNVPDEENTARNFVPKSLVRTWMQESVERLYALQPDWAGAVAADGGRPAEDVLAGMPEVSWKKTTGDFFLTL